MKDLIRAELRKLFTTRAWWGMLIGVVVVSLAFAGLIAAIAGADSGDNSGLSDLNDPATVRTIYTAGISITYLFSLAAGVLAMSGEWRHQTISATFLASPHRGRVVIAKVSGLVVLGALYGAASMVCGIGLGAPIVAARGGSTHLFSDGIPRSAGLAVLAVALWALFGLGIATLIRNQIVALLVSVGVAWIVQPILGLIISDALNRPGLAAYLPSEATSAMLSPSTGSSASDLLPWWGGALVMLAYAAVFAAVGAAVTLRRDVT
jgi:ABC-2 type transport system permease protein